VRKMPLWFLLACALLLGGCAPERPREAADGRIVIDGDTPFALPSGNPLAGMLYTPGADDEEKTPGVTVDYPPVYPPDAPDAPTLYPGKPSDAPDALWL